MTEQHVYILLGTFDGASYVQQQLDSIRAQTHTNWTLLVRDDGSHDATIEIVRRVSDRDPRVEILSGGDHVGCATNFSRLGMDARRRGAVYTMFCDQDDVWFPTKVEKTLQRMLDAEKQTGPTRPILVHTDLYVINNHGTQVHPSFMKFQRISHTSKPLRTLLVQNFVTGCTVMANRSLLDIAMPIPPQALMHDWWLALVAASTGTVAFLPETTIGYRRHGTNALLVRGFWRTMNPFKTDWRLLWCDGASNHGRAVLQAEALLVRLRATKSSELAAESTIRAFIDLHDGQYVGMSRLGLAIRNRFSSQSIPRTAVLYLRLLFWRRLRMRGVMPAENQS
jgi:hypothetical protein